MRRVSRLILWLLLAGTAVAWAVPPLKVETELKTPESPLPFGKSAEIILTLNWSEKLKFEAPKAEELELGELVVLDTFTTSPASLPGEKALQYHLIVTLFKPAKVEIRPIQFSTAQGTVQSKEITLEFVGAKKPEGDKLETLRPPKQTVELSTSSFWRTWLGRIAACLAIVGLLLAAFSHFGIFDLFLSPKKRALKKLKRLRSRNGDPGATLIELLEIHRDYLRSAYGLKTREAGTAEILQQLDDDSRCRHLKGLTRRLAVPADLAKFAARKIESQVAVELLDLTQQTIKAESRSAK